MGDRVREPFRGLNASVCLVCGKTAVVCHRIAKRLSRGMIRLWFLVCCNRDLRFESRQHVDRIRSRTWPHITSRKARRAGFDALGSPHGVYESVLP